MTSCLFASLIHYNFLPHSSHFVLFTTLCQADVPNPDRPISFGEFSKYFLSVAPEPFAKFHTIVEQGPNMDLVCSAAISTAVYVTKLYASPEAKLQLIMSAGKLVSPSFSPSVIRSTSLTCRFLCLPLHCQGHTLAAHIVAVSSRSSVCLVSLLCFLHSSLCREGH